MPLYEYECKECGARFEVLQAIGATGEDLTCPECETPNPQKVFSIFASGTNAAGSSSASCGTGGFS